MHRYIDLTVSSCSFTQHPEGGLTFASDGRPTITSRIINCTFDNPDAINGGIEFRSIGGVTTTDVKIVNTILWNNGTQGPLAQTATAGGLTINTENCVFDPTTLTVTPTEINTIIVAPEYVDSSNADYTLADSSPLIDAGISTGLKFNGSTNDIGSAEAGGCILNSTEELVYTTYKNYPNPVINQHTIELNADKSYVIEITDLSGKVCSKNRFENVALALLELGHLDAGSYMINIIELQSQNVSTPIKLMKI